MKYKLKVALVMWEKATCLQTCSSPAQRKMADIYFEKSNQDKKEKAAQIFTDNKTAKLPTY